MVGNTITNPNGCIINLLMLSDLTNNILLRYKELRRAEERVKPFIVDKSKELPDEQPLIPTDGSYICSRGTISVICSEAKSK